MEPSPLITPPVSQPQPWPPVDLLTGGSVTIVWAVATDLARLGLHRARQRLRAVAPRGRCARSGCPAAR